MGIYTQNLQVYRLYSSTTEIINIIQNSVNMELNIYFFR